jgi:hypothetical protein
MRMHAVVAPFLCVGVESELASFTARACFVLDKPHVV